jgi:hypothetical protein
MATNNIPTQDMAVPMDDAPAPTFRLFDLPIELQIMCLQSLCDHCREINGDLLCCTYWNVCNFECPRALARFCLASRYCQSLAQPILYHRVQVGPMGWRLGHSKLGPLLRLLRTIVTRPDLAAQVRIMALNLDINRFEMPLTQDERRMIMDSADQLQISFPASMGRSQKYSWIDVPDTLPIDYYHGFLLDQFRGYSASILIALALNATTLDIHDCSSRLDRILEPLERAAVPNRLKLRLRRLRIGNELELDKSLAEVAFFFRVAPITELTMVKAEYFFCQNPFPFPIRQPVEALASLKRLDLIEGELNADNFRSVVQHCPNLEHLAFLSRERRWTATPREISQILSYSPLRHKLKTLSLERFRDLDTAETIGTLHALTALERLIIGGNALLGGSTDPTNPNLQHEHGEGDTRLSNILPPNLLHLDMFNLGPRGARVAQLLADYKADVAREREQTGLRHPRALKAIGLDYLYDWERYLLRACSRPNEAPGQFFCPAQSHLYMPSESG